MAMEGSVIISSNILDSLQNYVEGRENQVKKPLSCSTLSREYNEKASLPRFDLWEDGEGFLESFWNIEKGNMTMVEMQEMLMHNEPTKDTTKNANNVTQYSLTLIWTDTIGSKDRTAEESQCSLTALWTDNGNDISKDPLAEETQCSLTALWTDISDTKGDDRNEEIHESVIDISYEDTEETLPYIEFFLNIFKKMGLKMIVV